MNQNFNLRNLLTICIPTYNRCSYLKKTLEYLCDSPFKDCEIYVLNNASTDDTAKLSESFPNVTIINNRFNIGYSNILRCAEYGTAPYLWIIGDDDEYDFSYTEDIIRVMSEGKIGLIHVGAHTDKPWTHGGRSITPRNAVNLGYPFFKYTSFIGCNIIRRDYVEKYTISGYNNLGNGYPHMPCLFSFFENEETIYISKNQIAKAVVGNQSYNFDRFLLWWGETSKLLGDIRDQKECFFQQFCFGNKFKMLSVWRYKYLHKQLSKRSFDVSLQFFSAPVRIASIFGAPFYSLYRMMTKKRLD